jgi:hypothetical protein
LSPVPIRLWMVMGDKYSSAKLPGVNVATRMTAIKADLAGFEEAVANHQLHQAQAEIDAVTALILELRAELTSRIPS